MHDLDQLCEQIAELQVRRRFFIGLTNKQTNSAKALVRRAFGWRGDGEEADREAINKRATRVVTAALAGKPQKEEDAYLMEVFGQDLAVIGEALKPCEAARAEIEKAMIKAAKKLPAHAWQKSVHGFGEKALAIIVGEAGNLNLYSHPDKLKKRLGIAPYQGKAFSMWRREGGLTAEEWIDAGYAPKRRAELHAVMEPLFKHQTVKSGIYRQAYDVRRAHTAGQHPGWKPIQSHMDGLRVMTQRLVIDLWSEWRRAGAVAPMAMTLLPSPSFLPTVP